MISYRRAGASVLTLVVLHTFPLIVAGGDDKAVIVDINARTNGVGSPIAVDLEAGRYLVAPIGMTDGGRYDAWLASDTNPQSWTTAYAVSSNEFDTIEAWDGKIYPTATEALLHAQRTAFTLEESGTVLFFNFDSVLGDNVGGTSLVVTSEQGPFKRGDVNADGRFDISDPIINLQCLFFVSRCPLCSDTADANDDGKVDVSDSVYLLRWQFLGEAPPPAPFDQCGLDQTGLPLGPCTYPPCTTL